MIKLPTHTDKIIKQILDTKPITKGKAPNNKPPKKIMEQKFKYDIESG